MSNRLRISSAIFLVAAASQAFGFGSEPPILLGIGEPNHELITQAALSAPYAFTTASGKVIIFGAAEILALRRANAHADNQTGNLNDPDFHFDEESFQSSINKPKSGGQNLYNWRLDIVRKARAGDYAGARDDLGRALHLVQDFYAHTNWVETKIAFPITPTPQLGEPNPFANIVGLPLASGATCTEASLIAAVGLTSGWFDSRMLIALNDVGWSTTPWRDAGLITNPLATPWPADKCIHGGKSGSGLNKDGQARTSAFSIVVNGVTLNGGFQAARAFAVQATRQYVNLVLSDLANNDAAVCGLLSESTALAACTATSAAFADTFTGSSLNPNFWNAVSGIGGYVVGGDTVRFNQASSANTQNKVHFSGGTIVLEGKFGGLTANGRDTNFALIDVVTGEIIISGDTSYFGWGLYMLATGRYNLTGANESRGAPTGGINMSTNGVTTSAYRFFKLTVSGASITIERGTTYGNYTERLTRTMGASISGRTFYLQIGTGGGSAYSPGTFDWVTVTTDQLSF